MSRVTFWRLDGQARLSELLCRRPQGSGRKVWGPPNFFFFLLATRRKHREGEVRLAQGSNHFAALRVRVKQKREGSPTPPGRSERMPIICIMEMRSLYLEIWTSRF